MKTQKQAENMRNIDSISHLRGESLYIDDLPIIEGTLFGAVYGSPYAHAKIKNLDLSEALASEGVVRILTHEDIIKENEIGTIIADQELFASEKVVHVGQPVAFVLATSEKLARLALPKIKIEVEELEIITDPRVAQAKGELLVPSRTFVLGDSEYVAQSCEHVFEGTCDINGQEHLYLETHGAYAWPTEQETMKVVSSTQAPAHVQEAIHKVTGMPISCIEAEVYRLGGAFGGKEVQADTWAAMVGLAVVLLKKPVKLCLHRHDDLTMSGKRHPYSFNYKLGLDKDFKIRAYTVECFQNGGAFADISPAIMERTLFHATASYNVPNAKVIVHSCKTNLPPNTAFRGFGAPQAMFAIESALYRASEELNVDMMELQRINLLKDGDVFPYGQVAEKVKAADCFEQVHTDYQIEKMKKDVADFNAKNATEKKGLALFPVCFGISFTTTFLNQGRALVHCYPDGTVGVSTGVIEMGQGVNTKIIQVAASTLSINPDRIRIIPTNTTRVANASPTAASSGADLNGGATQVACLEIVGRLRDVAAKLHNTQADKVVIKNEVVYVDNEPTELKWTELVNQAIMHKVSVSEHGHYATPDIYFDKKREKGRAFSYHVYGTCASEVTVDCLRGIYSIDKIKVVHDFGTSINEHIDFGQVEGALMQGLGLVTNEELIYNEKGKLVSDGLSSYKVPDIQFAPEEFDIKALDSEPAPGAIFGSKAVGEPPLMYGFATYFALQNAIREYHSGRKLNLTCPMTHQLCLETLYDGKEI